ncbi:hypothetical protein QE430_002459 [Microbacterium testaceum]|uniref:hypothetical protein n=1 Tax=Microbacterium testaceum TaxID=2033 RepID=UPI0027804491|nr:hypothetical protein [Microbacterium testaceum]MDQ1174152.1 hypothetical protein [Microbacterium testaceum]
MPAGLTAPAPSLLDKTGLKRMAPLPPLILPGLLAYWEPGTMADRSLVPANGALIENQSGWGIDLLGEQARFLTVANTIATGTVSRPSGGAFDVVHGRGVATGVELFGLSNQRIRDHIDGNRSRRIGQFWGYEVLQAPASYSQAISQRFSGLVDASNYKEALALSADRTQVTGYPTSTTRVFNQPGSATGGRNLAITAHDGYTGAASTSSTLFLLHNGGANAPAMSARTFMWGLIDYSVLGMTPTVFATYIQARYNENLAMGGIYAA